jgi:fatty acid desaturase
MTLIQPNATIDGDLPRPHPYTATYAEILRTVKAHGLLARRRDFYIPFGVVLFLALAGLIVGSFFLGSSWWQLALAAGLGIILTQFAFLGHELAHRQVFESGKLSDRIGNVIAHLIVGISYSWWTNKHTRHHTYPNQIGKDTDIESSVVVFYPEQERTGGRFQRFVSKRQGWLFFPLLTLEGLNLQVQGIKRALSDAKADNRVTELVLLFTRAALLVTFALLVMGPWIGLAFLVVYTAVFGVYMGASFAPNHKGMPIIPADKKVDFFQRQVLTSRNIRGNRFMDFLMGGLNYQVEHHLFPNMPRPSLAKAAAIVKEYCRTHNVDYTETGLFRSYGIVVSYLNRVGLAAMDPFECPMAQAAGR